MRDRFLWIRPGVVVACDHDPAADGFDDIAVPVQFRKVESGKCRAGRPQNECRLFAGGFRGHGDFASDDFFQIKRQL